MPIALVGPGQIDQALESDQPVTGSYSDIAQTLDNSVVFIAVYTHMWTGQSKIRNALVKLGHTELEKDMVTNPRWNLLPEDWRKKFTGVHSQVQRAVDQASVSSDDVSFPIRGVHVIARRAYKEFATQIKDIEKNDFVPLVRQLVKQWPQIVDDFRKDIKDPVVWAALAPKLPQASRLSEKFWIEIIRVPIKFSTDTTLEAVSDIEMVEIAEQGQRFAKNIAGMIVGGLEDELRNSIDNLLGRIHEKGVIKQATLDMVKAAFKKLQDFDFVMTDALKEKINQNKELLMNSDYKELNNDIRHDTGQIAATLVKYLQTVREQSIADAAIVRAFGRTRRAIRT